MKYEYCGISLGDDIKDIISKFNISKIKYEKDLKYLSFKLGKVFWLTINEKNTKIIHKQN